MARRCTNTLPSRKSAPSAVAPVLDALRLGRVVVLTREQPTSAAVLLFSGELATPETVAFVVRHTTGFLRVALPHARSAALGLPSQVWPFNTAAEDQCVTVDAAAGVSTGISAADRARTIQLLSSAATRPDELSRPGHIVPVRVGDAAQDLRGFAGAGVELLRLAGLGLSAGYAELVSVVDARELASVEEARRFTIAHGLRTADVIDAATCSAVAYRDRLPLETTRTA
jgi:3,4-dihydroxy 2-butanone 4-phosphate synthase/GTP cyclohydrolase II